MVRWLTLLRPTFVTFDLLMPLLMSKMVVHSRFLSFRALNILHTNGNTYGKTTRSKMFKYNHNNTSDAVVSNHLSKYAIKRTSSQNTDLHRSFPNSSKIRRVIIAVGTNVGDRYGNLMKSMAMIEETKKKQFIGKSRNLNDEEIDEALIRIISTSFLRETPPMYVTNQPTFLNGAIEIETNLSPHTLLKRLKDIETKIGRDLSGRRNGPRPIDLDIIYYGIHNIENDLNRYGGSVIKSLDLIVPHPRIAEREFVLEPLCDIGKNILHPILRTSSKDMLQTLKDSMSKVDEDSSSEAIQIIPLPRNRFLKFDQILIMGILNVTPDSFSDGGNYSASVELAVKQALKMESDGASIIDIGGESTRPGAKEVEIEIELGRTIPVIKKIREGTIIRLVTPWNSNYLK